ncbi:MAG: ABC transporter permease [Clostridia bacterium]|nr:ABC transporter permease [Clostridia bacterium]MBQ3495475.1 ABC transporter permease [Clostridia bacterium]MBQ4587493.1 ABC transporter permease [Clostridia bacterium]MBQ6883123.1 ABC transporter permease [Clostridia bacterium]
MGKALKFSRKNLGIPYFLFLCLFVIFPLLLIVVYAFTDGNGSLTFANFIDFFTKGSNIYVLFISFALAILTTAICLVIAYPVSYILARTNMKAGSVYLLLFILPMWINFVLRTAAMKELLFALDKLGVYNITDWYFANTVIGMVYDYLPFTILPIYTVLIKLDKNVLEASSDLGANKVQTFLRTTLPLSLPGIVSAITMVLLPTTTSYVISDTLGNSKVTIIGKLIENQFNIGTADSWHTGSAISLILLCFIFGTMLLTGKFNERPNQRGGGLW